MHEDSDTPQPRGVSRRRLLATAASAGALAALGDFEVFAVSQEAAVDGAPVPTGPTAALSSAIDRADVLERMRVELLRALAKTPAERRWVMVIDLRKCSGCHACTIACVAENKLPPGVVYRPVTEHEFGTYPNVGRRFVPRPCMQCERPPCVPVCPVNATYTNEEGVVVVNYEQCIGCRACLTACPYGARTSDFGLTYGQEAPTANEKIVGRATAERYELAPNFEYGQEWPREPGKSPMGNARKCHFCLHRVKEGALPACVTSCLGRATMFGDANDPQSLVAEMIARPNVMRLKEELGTNPRVYYLA